MENGLTRAQWRYSDGDTTWLNYRFSDGETTVLYIVYDCGTCGFWSLFIFGLTIYIMYSFWVSLGWFYLLDIHCDFSLISPLCGVAPTPDCGTIIFAASSRGVIQTLAWHRHYYSCSFLSRSHSDPRLAPSILPLSIFTYLCASWFFVYFVTGVWSHNNPEYVLIYYPHVLNVCEYIQTYSLACPWLLSWLDSLRGDKHCGDKPRNLRVDMCSLAKIGVILVSCSCGKWSPIDTDVSNRFRLLPLVNQMLYS